ncbi:putative G-protein coupled receptor [Hypsibius exemplaris]|uniref:G-protein coupled receptor n=1 Tax=Hypsibius exemplaris TaxID=2072580 RepID=A0A1W0WJL6_HYPEX|nr:putative G-protein coupled receptor [Hypsibius exemplaris]
MRHFAWPLYCCLLQVMISVGISDSTTTATPGSPKVVARRAKIDTDTANHILSTMDSLKSQDELLDVITNLTEGAFQCHREVPVPVRFDAARHFPDVVKQAHWMTNFLVDYIQTSGQSFETPSDKGFKFLHRSFTNLFDYESKLVYLAVKLPPNQEDLTKVLELYRSNDPVPTVRHKTSTLSGGSLEPEYYELLIASNFHVYYSCPTERWLAKMAFPLNLTHGKDESDHVFRSQSSVMVLAVDITDWDIYQCNELDIKNAKTAVTVAPSAGIDDAIPRAPTTTTTRSHHAKLIDQFAGSAKCHRDTNDCIFHPGFGWRKASYSCRCRAKYYPLANDQLLPGGGGASPPPGVLANDTQWGITAAAVVVPIGASGYGGSGLLMLADDEARGLAVECAHCRRDCDACTNGLPCFYVFNRPLRILLLSVAVLCIICTLALGIFIHKYRRVKVIRVASPKFLCITLLGAAVMYSETIAIFFEDQPDIYVCMAIEWTRHLGFLITYSSLFMKTWRISGLFRVKSAHKIKLSDKQLLQWMCPILLIMIIYLASWSAGAPAAPEILENESKLKYPQCAYGWWDHCLVVGNVVFLVWGIRVCYRVRKAESYFNEAKFISFAIYNIAGANAIFLLLHLVVYPQASPDIKYVFAFVRIQLSTSVTVFLVFCPKVLAICRGQGENFEFHDRPGAQIPLNINGTISNDDVIDVFQENEDLKDEIQKLASQIEWMKIVHMNMGNRHLKAKHSSAQYHLAASYFPPSPILRSLRRRSSDAMEYTTARLSPAAELASERV